MAALTVPNHHAHHPAFGGVRGSVAAMSMTAGRRGLFRVAAEMSDVRSGDHVVDIGCGPGAAAREVRRRGATYTGVDPSPVMLRWARWVGGRGTTWVEASAESLPLQDRAATVAWSLQSVHHWQDIAVGLGEIHRVLASGGRLVVVEADARPGATGLRSHGWTDAQASSFAEMCAAAGFDDVVSHVRSAGRRGNVHIVHALRP